VLVIVLASVGSLGVLAVLVLAVLAVCWRRRKARAKKDAEALEAQPVDVRVDLWSGTASEPASTKVQASPPSMEEPLAAALEPAASPSKRADQVPAALQRIRSLRMRASAPEPAPAAVFEPGSPGAEEDAVMAAKVERELGMEFDVLRELQDRNMERRAAAAENVMRLHQLRVQVQRAEALLMAHHNRERSVLSAKLLHELPAGHNLRSFDPNSFSNQALVTQQARVHATAARRSARARLFAMQNGGATPPADASLDPITGIIRRASLTGGRLHACDLASQSVRTQGERDGETDPDKWLLSVMSTPFQSGEPSLSPAVISRLNRARESRRPEERACGSTTRQSALRRVDSAPSGASTFTLRRVDSAPSALRTSPSGQDSSAVASSPTKPRSLFEIRAARDGGRSPRREGEGSTPAPPSSERLDPLTDALHTASMMGIEPPPPPRDWQKDGEVDLVALARDAPERVRRARSDREARLGLVSKTEPGSGPDKAQAVGVEAPSRTPLPPAVLATGAKDESTQQGLHRPDSRDGSQSSTPTSGGDLFGLD